MLLVVEFDNKDGVVVERKLDESLLPDTTARVASTVKAGSGALLDPDIDTPALLELSAAQTIRHERMGAGSGEDVGK
jgi:hypothetical protein